MLNVPLLGKGSSTLHKCGGGDMNISIEAEILHSQSLVKSNVIRATKTALAVIFSSKM